MKPLDFLMGVTVAVTWGMGLTFAKVGMGQFPPIMLIALRFSVTALALVWFVKPPLGMMWRILIVSFVIGTVQYSLTFTGLSGLDVSLAAIIIQMEVPFATLMAVIFLGDRLGAWQTAGMAVAFAGVVIIAGQPSEQSNISSLFLVLGGTLTWAYGNILVKKLGNSLGGFQLIAWVAVFTAPQLFIASFLLEDGQMDALANADMVGWGTVFYLGLVMTAFGYGLWFHLVAHNPVSHVMPFLLLLPVAAGAGGILMLGEAPTWRTIGGAILVLSGVALILCRQMRKTGNIPAAPQAVPPD
ncbi:MAG: EamA family transporter [Alphaproteobacteria bacterium]|nr:EamA family transporter [Alphaproteobacteria bacterium]